MGCLTESGRYICGQLRTVWLRGHPTFRTPQLVSTVSAQNTTMLTCGYYCTMIKMMTKYYAWGRCSALNCRLVTDPILPLASSEDSGILKTASSIIVGLSKLGLTADGDVHMGKYQLCWGRQRHTKTRYENSIMGQLFK